MVSTDPSANQHSPSSIRLLVADDFASWRQSVRSMLQAHAELQVVGEAADGLEVLQKAQTLEPDLILLDLGLPNLNGLEAAKRIRQVVPDARIVFLTATNDPDVVAACLRAGGLGYVLKTDAGTELVPALAAVRRGDRFVSSGVNSDGINDEES